MSKKKSLFLSLSLVLIVGLSIVAGTFAYFQWQAATGTQVNVTIEMGGIKMHIEPEATGFVGLYPTAHCINNVRYGDALVRIENNTGALAVPSFKLKVLINPSVPDTGKLSYYKEHVHYAVVALETNKDGSKKVSNGEVITVGGNTIDDFVTGTCSVPLNVSNTGDTDDTFKSDYNKNATGLFNVITAENTFADTAFLPREYNSTTGEVQGVTFRGEAYSTSYQWYRVYVWIDEGYTTTIVGNDVSDPLQNAQIQVTWSENSMLQQVSGVSKVDDIDINVPGLYSNSYKLIYNWDELIENEDITVVDNVIVDSNLDMTGILVIKKGITEIGAGAFGESDWVSMGEIVHEYGSSINTVYVPSSVTLIGEDAFEDSALTSIIFTSDSQLETIDLDSFYGTPLTSIEIPASVTLIRGTAFADCMDLTSVTFSPGSQLEVIEDLAFQSTGLTNISLPASLKEIYGNAFYDNPSLENITYLGTVAQWNAIDFDQGYPGKWYDEGPAIEVVCIDGVVRLIEPGLYDDYGALMRSWSDLESSGDIRMPAGDITEFNKSLTGRLVIPEGVLSINPSAFSDCSLTSVVVPSTVSYIDDEAFSGSDLEKIIFSAKSSLIYIGAFAFASTNLTDVEIPASVTGISDEAFSISSLINVKFAPGSQLQGIGHMAFYLSKISSIEIPASVTFIGDGAFLEIQNLHTIKFKGTVEQWNAIDKADGIDYQYNPYAWNEGVPATYVQCSDGRVNLN